MTEIEDRLAPADGLSDFNIEFRSMENKGGGGAQFNFEITNAGGYVGELPIIVEEDSQGLNEMMVQAHDCLIDVLRQLVFRADIYRRAYEKRSVQYSQPKNADPL